MPKALKILAVHGVGGHEAGGAWTERWRTAITESLGRAAPDTEADIEFVAYDDIFEEERFTALGTLEAVGKLLGSGLRFGIGDRVTNWLGRSGLRARGLRAIPDRIRWTAGMVVQWIEDDKLRARARDRLAQAIRDSDPQVVLAHSLGSLIGYDTLLHPKHAGLLAGRIFVTLGSQIGNPFIRAQYAGRIEPVDCEHWYHLFNPEDDVFTSPIRLAAGNFEQVECYFDIAGMADHDAAEYLRHASMSSVVWRDVLVGKRVRATGRAVRANILDRGRHPRRALLVGINDYPTPEARLEGCVNDVFLMSEALQELGFDPSGIRTVLDSRATAGAIRERIEWLLDGARPGDERVLYYSGHGAQITDYGSDETLDRKDECLVPVDFDWDRANAVTDDWFHELYSQLPYDTRFLAVLDCCHSGGMTRASIGRHRGINPPDDIRHRELEWDVQRKVWKARAPKVPNKSLWKGKGGQQYLGKTGSNRRLGRATDLRALDNRNYNDLRKRFGHHGPYLPVILQACQEDELAFEYRHGVTPYGAFTYALVQELRAVGPGHETSFVALGRAAARRLRDMGYDQRPDLVGPANVTGQPIWLGQG